MKYSIIHIQDGSDPVWGDVVAVIANEARWNGHHTSFNPFYNDNSKIFIFPNREFIEPIEKLDSSCEFWTPSEDFSVEDRNLEDGEDVTMFFHSSLYGADGYDRTLNSGYSSTIKNFEDKVSEIWDRYQKETDGSEWISDYIKKLPKVDLLKWLFEIEYLTENDLDCCSLRKDEYERFVERLEEIEEETAD